VLTKQLAFQAIHLKPDLASLDSHLSLPLKQNWQVIDSALTRKWKHLLANCCECESPISIHDRSFKLVPG
jgi:hypothetical protein